MARASPELGRVPFLCPDHSRVGTVSVMPQTIAIPALREMPETDDHTLVKNAASGDPLDQRRLLDRVTDRIRRTSHCLTRTREEAEDFTQLVLIEIIRSAGTFRGECSLNWWVDRLTIQTAAKHIEKRVRRRKAREAYWHPAPLNYSVEEEVSAKEIRARLLERLAALPRKQRVPVVLHCLYEYEVPEIAALTGSKVNTVRGRLRRGLKKIRTDILRDPSLSEFLEESMT